MGLGVKVSVPSGLSATVPCGSVTGLPTAIGCPAMAVMASGLPSASLSLRRGSKVTGLSSVAGTVSGAATGGSATGLTLSVSVAEMLAVPSLTV